MKSMPPEIADWFFSFNWDVKFLWSIEGKEELRNVNALDWHFAYPFWSSTFGDDKSNDKMLFDLKPLDVLNNPGKWPHQDERINHADLEHPICVMNFQGKELIMDGMHRLANASKLGMKTIKVKVINESLIPEIIDSFEQLNRPPHE